MPKKPKIAFTLLLVSQSSAEKVGFPVFSYPKTECSRHNNGNSDVTKIVVKM